MKRNSASHCQSQNCAGSVGVRDVSDSKNGVPSRVTILARQCHQHGYTAMELHGYCLLYKVNLEVRIKNIMYRLKDIYGAKLN